MNKQAMRVFGDTCLGKACHEVVRGVAPEGAPLCRPGCARELAQGMLFERGEQPVLLREKATPGRMECARVGSDVHVLIELPLPTSATERLTPRERRVLSLVARGLSSTQIARELGVSVSTVRTHVEHARGRLGATTRAQAVLVARETGQLDDL